MLLWVLLWVVLLLGAGLIFFVLGRNLWRKARALITELGEASERLTAILASINDLADSSSDRGAGPH
jgi:hypothetical protein